MDVQFTAGMELKLDEIEEQHLDWIKLLKDFYGPFHETVDGALDKLDHAGGSPSPYKCDKCGKPMVYRISKNGFFLSCSDYPECDGIRSRSISRASRNCRRRANSNAPSAAAK